MRIFCTAKDSHIFSTKNNSVFVIFTFENLTKRKLTTSLISNNRPLLFTFVEIKAQISCTTAQADQSNDIYTT